MICITAKRMLTYCHYFCRHVNDQEIPDNQRPRANTKLDHADVFSTIDELLAQIESGTFKPDDFCWLETISSKQKAGEELLFPYDVHSSSTNHHARLLVEDAKHPATLNILSASGKRQRCHKSEVLEGVAVYHEFSALELALETAAPTKKLELLFETPVSPPITRASALHLMWGANRSAIVSAGVIFPLRQDKSLSLVLHVGTELRANQHLNPVLVVLTLRKEKMKEVLDNRKWLSLSDTKKWDLFAKHRGAKCIVSPVTRWDALLLTGCTPPPQKALQVVQDYHRLSPLSRKETLEHPGDNDENDNDENNKLQEESAEDRPKNLTENKKDKKRKSWQNGSPQLTSCFAIYMYINIYYI